MMSTKSCAQDQPARKLGSSVARVNMPPKIAVGPFLAAVAHAQVLLGPALEYLSGLDEVSHLADLDMLEMFAGVMAIARGFTLAGMVAAAYDVELDSRMDLLTPMGLVLAVQLIRRIKPLTGFIWLGPPCSTWVFMSRGSTGRAPSCPEGDGRCWSAELQNVLVSRLAALLIYAASLGIPFVVEQPSTSIMELHPCFQELSALLDMKFVTCHLGAFGGDTPKLVKFMGTVEWLEDARLKVHVSCVCGAAAATTITTTLTLKQQQQQLLLLLLLPLKLLSVTHFALQATQDSMHVYLWQV